MTELAERIERAVAEVEAEQTAFLQRIVRTPSQTGDEGAVQQVVAAEMARLGLATDVWEPQVADLAPWAESVETVESYHGRPNVVGTRRGTGGGRSLVLNAHIDTVEPGDPTAWDRPPLSGEIADGRLHGRGSCDMKAGLATNLFAVEALRRAGFRLRGDVHVESTISEEDGGAGALAAIVRGYRADAALITEPTRLAIIAGQGGSLMFRLHVPGRSAHACVRDEGVSAIEAFARLHQGLLAFEARRNRAIDDPLYASYANKIPINIGTLRAGSWPSSVPEWLVAEGRAEMVPGEDLQTFKGVFRDEVARIAAGDPWLRDHPPTVEWLSGQFAAAGVPADSPLVETLAAAHRAATGEAAPVEGVTYGADMRHFVLAGGMPCAMYGAGDVRLAHAPNESVPLDEVRTATRTVAGMLAAWCGVADDA